MSGEFVSNVDAKIAARAGNQLGVFTHAQAVKAGATRGLIEHRLRTRRWEQLYRGVYRLRGTPKTLDQSQMAACLAAGEGVISHAAAAAKWQFPGFDHGLIEITIRRSRRFRADFPVHQSNYLPKTDLTKIGVIPITTPLRTVIDLAAVCSKDILEEIFDDALVRGLATIEKVDRWLQKMPAPVPGIGLFREVVDARREGGTPESVMETRLFRHLRRRGIELPELQYQILSQNGRLILRADFAYLTERIVIEMDSRGHHSRAKHFDRDRAISNELGILGWLVLRFTWPQLRDDPDSVCDEIMSALEARRVTNTAM